MTSTFCSKCGFQLPEGLDASDCPRCLLQLGLRTAEFGQALALNIRCPHCHNPVELLDEAPLHDITCPTCDSHFSLIDDHEVTRPPNSPQRLAHFELLDCVGIGGFGTVWKARDTQLDRTVAVKIPRNSQLSKSEAEQFFREARAAAQLRHPNIVSVHEVGRADNQFYIVSDLVDGVTLADQIRAQLPSPREAATLCLTIAQALEHAHQHGVIHRDLKPSNILLEQVDLTPVSVRDYDELPTTSLAQDPVTTSPRIPHITDFGLARRISGEITMTLEGKILGTPAYMSPEQARGDGHQADARSDIYSLGVILFELLTGEKPFRGNSRMLIDQVIHDTPPSPKKLNRSLPRDLETICLKCMAKQPSHRYPTAAALAADLERFLRGEPIFARPVSLAERTIRWCRRKPLVAALTASVAGSIVLGMLATVWQWRVAEKERMLAEERGRQTETALNESASRLARTYVERGLQTWDTNPLLGLPWLVEAFHTEPLGQPRITGHRIRWAVLMNELPHLVQFWPSAGDAKLAPDGNSLAVAIGGDVHLYELADFQLLGILHHATPVRRLEFSPDGRRLATVTLPEYPGLDRPHLGECQVWDLATQRRLHEARVLDDPAVPVRGLIKLSFTSDGKYLIGTKTGLHNRWHSFMTIGLFDPETLEQVGPTFAHHNQIDVFDGYHKLSPDGLRVMVPNGLPYNPADDSDPDWSGGKLPQLFDLRTGQAIHEPLDHELDFYAADQFCYSPDGQLAATANEGLVKLWKVSSGELDRQISIPAGDTSRPAVRFHPSGTSLFIVQNSRAIWWDLEKDAPRHEWTYQGQFSIDPSGQYVTWSDKNADVNLIVDLTTPNMEPRKLPRAWRATFSSDGSLLILDPASFYEGNDSGQPKARYLVRTADGQRVTPPWRFRDGISPGSFSAGSRYYVARDDAGLWLWDLAQKPQALNRLSSREPQAFTGGVIDLAHDASHETFATMTGVPQITTWNAKDGSVRKSGIRLPSTDTEAGPLAWQRLALNPQGNVAVTVGTCHPKQADTTSEVPFYQLWDVRAGVPLCKPTCLNNEPWGKIEELHFAPDGQTLILIESIRISSRSASLDYHLQTRLHRIDVQTGAALEAPRPFPYSLRIRGFSADGKRCLVVQADRGWPIAQRDGVYASGTAQMWNTESWQPMGDVIQLTDKSGDIMNASLSPQGTHAVMGNGELWQLTDVPTLIRQVPLAGSNDHRFLFFADGQSFVTASRATYNRWDDPVELRRFATVDGSPIVVPGQMTRIGGPHWVMHPTFAVMAGAGRGLRLWDAWLNAPLSSVIDLPDFYSYASQRTMFFSADERTLYLESMHDVLVFSLGDILDAAPPTESMTAWSVLLSGHRIDSAGGYVAATPHDLADAWKTLSTLRNRETPAVSSKPPGTSAP